MVSEPINFRYDVGAGTQVRLAHKVIKAGELTAGCFHFPNGCNSAVLVRILLSSRSAGGIRQICPIGNSFIALNDCVWEFTLAEVVNKGDDILVDMRNTGAEDHEISVIVTRFSDQPTGSELEAEDRKRRAEEQRESRRVGG